MYKAIIFDFFDVIRTDSFKAWLKKHNYKLEGDFLDANQKMDHGEIDVDEFISRLSRITGQTEHAIREDMDKETKVDYEVLAIIEELGKSYQIGLLSNAPSGFLRALLEEHGLEKYFDEILISSEVGMIKPNPEIFRHILSKMEIEPNEALFIDDNPKNTQAAEVIGINSIVHTDAPSLKTALKKYGLIA